MKCAQNQTIWGESAKKIRRRLQDRLIDLVRTNGGSAGLAQFGVAFGGLVKDGLEGLVDEHGHGLAGRAIASAL
jgi:hypothetical protein